MNRNEEMDLAQRLLDAAVRIVSVDRSTGPLSDENRRDLADAANCATIALALYARSADV